MVPNNGISATKNRAVEMSRRVQGLGGQVQSKGDSNSNYIEVGPPLIDLVEV